MRITSKFKPYLVRRLAPVALLWVSIYLVALVLPAIAAAFSGNGAISTPLNLSSFADDRLIMVLFVATISLVGLISLIGKNLTMTQEDAQRAHNLTEQWWDEFSSGATHIAYALGVLMIGRFSGWNLAGALGYIALAVLAFDERTAQHP